MNLKANRIQKTVLKEEIGKHVHKSKYRTFKKTNYVRVLENRTSCVCVYVHMYMEREREIRNRLT